MDKDQVEGKAKDIAGRVQRQVGEWTGSTKEQAEGAAKQVEGKVQNAWGKAKDAVTKDSAPTSSKPPKAAPDPADEDSDEPRAAHR